MASFQIFGKWSMDGITVEDPGLIRYISTTGVLVPKTGARYAGNKFHKSKVNPVERLVNKFMVPGHKAKKHFKTSYHCTGKGTKASNAIRDCFSIIEEKTKKNP